MRSAQPATGLIVGLLVALLISWFWVEGMSHDGSLIFGVRNGGGGVRNYDGTLVFWAVKEDPFLSDGVHWRSADRSASFNDPVRNWFGSMSADQNGNSFRVGIPHWVFVLVSIFGGISSFFWKKLPPSDNS